MIRAKLTGRYGEDGRYPVVVVNVTKRNEHRLEELVVAVRQTQAGWMTPL